MFGSLGFGMKPAWGPSVGRWAPLTVPGISRGATIGRAGCCVSRGRQSGPSSRRACSARCRCRVIDAASVIRDRVPRRPLAACEAKDGGPNKPTGVTAVTPIKCRRRSSYRLPCRARLWARARETSSATPRVGVVSSPSARVMLRSQNILIK